MAKILVVDDAAFMRLRACKLLTEAGHTVVEAENGRWPSRSTCGNALTAS